jgi:DNA-binding NtrC family response regulator
MSITVQFIDGKETDYTDVINYFKERGCHIVFSASGKKALQQVKKEKPDVVFLSLDTPDLSGSDVVRKIKKNGQAITLYTVVTSPEQGIETMKLGAEYYFCKPCSAEEVEFVFHKFLAAKYYQERIEKLRLWYLDQLENSEMVIASKSMKELYQQVLKISEDGNAPVLLVGEVGTGKELLAKIIHLRSPYFMFPFAVINCKDKNTLSLDTLLYGFPKGADKRKGGGEAAYLSEGGTLFLYNSEYLTKSDQTKLLKFLKSRKIARGKQIDHTAVGKRIIVAASVNLKTLVDKGKFNKELYQAVSKRSIHIPPLKKRSSAIVPLAMHFIKAFNRDYGKEVKRIDADVRSYLTSYDWPGNVSELKNVMEHVVIISQGESISMKDMAFRSDKKMMSLDSLLLNGSFLSLDEMVALYVKTVLKKVKGNKSKAAKLLRVSRNTLKKKSVVM